MPIEFCSWFDFFKFSHSVRTQARHIHKPSVFAFLDTLLNTSSKRHIALTDGHLLWRAQLGSHRPSNWDEPAPHLPERMKPLPHLAQEGRVNPNGIPCLYLATSKETAMAEVRPLVGSLVSTAAFRILKNLTLIDFSVGHDVPREVYLDEPPPEERERSIWAQVDRAFSEPASANPAIADYVPTQVISEFFRHQGFDGVAYKSRLGPGVNIAIFDLAAAQLVSSELFKVSSVEFKFEAPTNSYRVANSASDPGHA